MRRWRSAVAGLIGVGVLALLVLWVAAPRGLQPSDAQRVRVGMTPAEATEALGRLPDRSELVDFGDDPRTPTDDASVPLADRLDLWESGSTVIQVCYWRGRATYVLAMGGGSRWSRFVKWVESQF